jgi:AGCS family alanine or glycine:cation symporter
MLIFYVSLGIYVVINSNNIIEIFKLMIKEAFNIKSIIPVFLIGMQRAIFISESGIGTSAISASSCDNDSSKQGMLEILGIHITTFLVCFVTFLIIVTSSYNMIDFGDINGIEIVMYAFNYHFGSVGKIMLTIITILFAFLTIISGYFFGENNIRIFTNNNKIINLFKIFVIIVIVISGYISPNILWNLTDYFIAILAIINISSILKIQK